MLLLFFLIPLGARLLKWIFQKAGLVEADPDDDGDGAEESELQRRRRVRSELARKEAELSFALEVQRALFPRQLPLVDGLEFAAVCIPASGISGD